ncbi:Hpt domain-containing protein [Maridesulfovibrio bastinii]|uniref:Hpt domain-containing protein n=1 Tax=Maridesulfovibrio bastinii TaxID=47157 RepID=UPI0004208182|nr:Hpt domain-containing protein [Maridesulfovibrio bastinii]
MSTGDRMLDIFQEETGDRLDSLESGLISLENSDDEYDSGIINSIFRDAHSIKAGSNLLKLSKIEELAHQLENVLEMVRTNEIEPIEVVITACLEAVDKLRDLNDDLLESNEKGIRLHVMMLKVAAKKALEAAK